MALLVAAAGAASFNAAARRLCMCSRVVTCAMALHALESAWLSAFYVDHQL
jgi:hypothetical protein